MAIAQLGTSVKVGFGTNTWTGYVFEEFTTESTGEQKAIRDQSNDTKTILISDEGVRISAKAIILETGGSLTPADLGASITINAIVYRYESVSVVQTREESIINFTAIKEDSMTYS